jgi:hypothetical protein
VQRLRGRGLRPPVAGDVAAGRSGCWAYPGHTWYGVSLSERERALAWRAPNFWTSSNCSTGHGRDSAHVFSYLNDDVTQPVAPTRFDPAMHSARFRPGQHRPATVWAV